MRTFSIRFTVLAILGIVFPINAIGEEIRDYYAEPGMNPFKDSINQNFNEHIDPFSGTLQLKYTDITIPGNGGLDININRVYTSIQTNSYPTLNINGFGWVMHFGRIVASQKHIDKICSQELFSVTTADNPSLEYPDGGRELLVLNSINNDGSLITRSNWKAECDGANPGMVVTSPEGTRYTMDQYDAFQGEPSWLTSRIEDTNGNWIQINYEQNTAGIRYITEILRSDSSSPIVLYEYIDEETAGISLSAIVANGQRWEYKYEPITGYLYDYYKQLKEVVRPDGRKWVYTYYDKAPDSDPDDDINEDGLGSYSLKKVTYPTGAEIEYTYQYVQFDPGSSLRTTAISTKQTSGLGAEPGAWTYQFSPGSVPFVEPITTNHDLYYDMTEVITPSSKLKYYHYGKYFYEPTANTYRFIRPSFVGLKAIEETYDLEDNLLERAFYIWGQREISNENYWHGAGYRSWWVEDNTYAPVLIAEYYDRDSNISDDYQPFHAKVYRDHDAYGNPDSIMEYANQQGEPDRETHLTYYIDTDKWIVNLLEDEQISAVINGSGETVGLVDRTYDDNGNLLLHDRFGVVTEYTYTPEGDIATITDARGNTSVFSDYKRGIAQTENLPESITITREINDTGTLASETNGRGFTSRYHYDGLNRLTRIDFPTNADVTIDYQDEGDVYKRTLTRNNYRQTDLFDAFGRLTSTERRDLTSNETITSSTEYDALGRVVFKSYPNSAEGVSYEYDALDRLTRKTHPDGSFLEYFYNDATVSLVNERSNATTYYHRIHGVDEVNKSIWFIESPESIGTLIYRNVLDQPVEIFQGELQGGSILGFARTYDYDSRFFLVRKSEPEVGDTLYTHDALGNVRSSRVGSSETTYYSYDGLNRLTLIDYPLDTPDVSYVYTANSQLERVTKGLTQWSYRYDDNDNLISETLSLSLSLSDSGQPELARTYSLAYQYNLLDALESITYPSGQLKGYTQGNGINTGITLNQRLFTEQIQTNGLLNLTYTYDPIGNITSIADAIDPTQNITMNQTDSYDGMDRLHRASGSWGTAVFNYNARGDLTDKTIGARQFSYEYDANFRLGSVSVGATYRRFGYDIYGNTSSRSDYDGSSLEELLFTYDNASHLVNAIAPTTERQYTYDGNGQRTIVREPGQYNQQYSVYSQTQQLLFEEDLFLCKTTDYIYLEKVLVARSDEQSVDPALDSDGDGINDCIESQLGLDPADPADAGDDADNDGISNKDEILIHGTYVFASDSDNDGLTDNDELSQHNTDPNLADSDRDGIHDGYEIQYGLNPNEEDGLNDADEDGLSNIEEFLWGTNPNLDDTDGDGFADRYEVLYGLDALNDQGPDLSLDSDVDGIPDIIEKNMGLDYLDVNDRWADIDGDGFSNLQEYLTVCDMTDVLSTPERRSEAWKKYLGAYDVINSAFENYRFSPLTISADGTLYYRRGDNQIVSLSPSGEVIWRAQPGPSEPSSALLASAMTVTLSGELYVGADNGILYALQADGELAWEYSTGGAIDASAAIGADGTIYIGSSDQLLHAIHPDGSLYWTFPTQGDIDASPVVGKLGTVYIGSNDGKLYALSPEGQELWSFPIGGEIVSAPALGRDGTVYIGSKNGYFYALHPSGSLKWKYYTQNEIHASPIIGHDGAIYVIAGNSRRRTLHAIRADGSGKWKHSFDTTNISGSTSVELGKSAVITADGNLLVSYAYGLFTLDQESGQVNWYWYPSGHFGAEFSLSPAVGQDGTVYVASYYDGSGVDRAGYIYALVNDDPIQQHSPWPALQSDLAHSGNQCMIAGKRYDMQSDLDGDLIPDCEEVLQQFDMADPDDAMLDVDADGLNNLQEYQAGTSYFNTDTDGDRLSDADEVLLYGTNPVSDVDSDQDGIADDYENVFGLNADVADAPTLDSDNDGFSNWQEYLAGTAPNDDNAIPVKGSLAWTYSSDVQDTHGFSPVIGNNGNIVAVGSGGYDTIELDRSGDLRWFYSNTSSNAINNAAAVGPDGSIYIISRNSLAALNSDGQLSWRYSPGSGTGFATDPAVDVTGTVYVGAYDTHLYAINAEGMEKWKFPTGDDVVATPAIGSDNRVYVGSTDGNLYALDRDNGELQWFYQMGGAIASSPAIGRDGTVYVGTRDGKLYAVSQQGTKVWEYSLSGPTSASAVVGADGTIYIGDDNGVLHAIKPDGSEGWSYSTQGAITSAAAVSANGTLYVNSSDGSVYALKSDGTLKWSYLTGGVLEAAPVIGSDGLIYVSAPIDYNLHLHVLLDDSGGVASAPWPMSRHDQFGSGNHCGSMTGYFSNSTDMDADGIPDCVEFARGLELSDPADALLDYDEDDLSNLNEFINGTNFYIADTDQDGLSDGEEVFTHNTDPLSDDMDHDGLNDGIEVNQGFNPYQSGEGLLDTDNDGFSNRQEGMSGYDPFDAGSVPVAGSLMLSEPLLGSLSSSLVMDEEGISYTAMAFGNLYAIYPDGSIKWSYDLGFSQAQLSLGKDGSVLVVGSGRVSAFSKAGQLQWSYYTGADYIYAAPAVGADGTIYFATSDSDSHILSNIYALDPVGTLKWSYELT